MEIQFLLLILLVTSATIQQTGSTTCPEASHPKTRTFSTLISYQGNKIPFDPRNSSMGNYVSFKFKAVETLPKNIFITFDSEHIIKLDLSGKNIRKIDDGAFLTLTCLKYLTLNNNSLRELTWKTFNGLKNLKELELNRNKLQVIPDMAFSAINRLSYLDLSNNLLKKLSPFTFGNMSELQHLYLQKNRLAYIQPEIFSPLKNLKTLDLSFNKFTDPQCYRWTLPNLNILNLSENFLRSFDTSLNYSFSNLRELNLSSNYLTDLNVHSLTKTFKKLTIIDLNYNYWTCDDLARILHYLADSRLIIPSRNTSKINELGIDCDNNTKIPHDLFEATTTIPSSSISVSPATHNFHEVKIVSQIQNLSVKNDQILLEISGVRKLLIVSLLFFVLFVIVYASIQVGLCDGLKRKFGRREGYINTSVQDNYSMLVH